MRFDLQACRQARRVDFAKIQGYCDEGRDLSKDVAGMIFHMSRCGSTLTTQMLRHSDAVVVVSEADVLGQFLQNFRGSEEELTLSLRSLIALLADSLCQPHQSLVIKWSSWNIYVISAICKAVPNTPLCYQYRAADEVLVSLINNKAEWMDVELILSHQRKRNYFSDRAFNSPYVELLEQSGGSDVPSLELAARFIGHCCERALQCSEQLLVVSYESMPQAVLTQIVPHFSIAMSGVEKSRARMVSRLDTKSLGSPKQFVPDTQAKRKHVTLQVKALANTHVNPFLIPLIDASSNRFDYSLPSASE